MVEKINSFHPLAFKVVCINEHGWCNDRSILWGLIKWKKRNRGPKIDDIVTVVDTDYEEGVKYYDLLEWPGNDVWQADCFAPIQECYEAVSFQKIKEEEAVSAN